VYQTLPVDKNNIVWGRVSETVEGNVQYVGLKVGANKKVILLKADQPDSSQQFMVWAQSIDAWARLNEFKGPKPF
jgi:hypothetical protein